MDKDKDRLNMKKYTVVSLFIVLILNTACVYDSHERGMKYSYKLYNHLDCEKNEKEIQRLEKVLSSIPVANFWNSILHNYRMQHMHHRDISARLEATKESYNRKKCSSSLSAE